MVIIIGNGHSDLSSKPGQGCLHLTLTNALVKGIIPIILSTVLDR